jgi:DnaJ-class molecular chaperone
MPARNECPECLGSGLAPNRRDFCRRCGGIGQVPKSHRDLVPSRR